MARKNNLFYIYKFNSDFLIHNALGKDMEYDTFQARKDLNLVSLADNQTFQCLRKIKGIEFNREKLDEIYKIRNDEKSLPKMRQDTKKIEDCQRQIDDILFVPDIINVKMTNKSHYKQLVNIGFKINGIKFVRFVCTAAYLRRNVICFINEKYFQQVNEILMCGLDGKLKETNLGKFSAYYGLFMSATNKVTTPNVCVIGDYETDLPDQEVNYITTNENGEEIIERRTMDLPMNWFDGMGLISPDMAEKWAIDLDLSYVPAGFIVRAPYIKGLCAPFDFHKFAKEVAYTDKIKDVWGKEYDISDIDIILTVSQFKMWKQYDSWQDYLFYFNKYEHSWGVSRVNKENDDEFVLTNYQYLQTLDLSHEDIQKLAQPTIDWINSIGSGDLMNVLLYLMGSRSDDIENAEEIFNDVQMDFVKGIMLNPDLLKDEFVKGQILKTLKRKIKDAKIGRLWVRGNYSFQISDPYALAEFAFGMEPRGLLKANEMYCNFWNIRTDKDVILCDRSPLVDSSEHLLRKRVQTDKMDEWYMYLWSGIVNSIWDDAVVYMSDSDYDGDIIFSTDNDVMINSVIPDNPPVTYAKRKAPNAKLTQKNLIKNDLHGFGSQIGQITNVASSMFCKQALFKPDSPEYQELEKRLKQMRKVQGCEIDAAKGLDRIPMEKSWNHKQKIDYENDTEAEIERKQFENRIACDKKPYFMSYIYPQVLQDYKQYVAKHNRKCLRYTGKTLNQIFDIPFEERTDIEKKMINQYNRYMPVMKNDCIMNHLCMLIEDTDFDLRYFKQKEEFDWTILLNDKYEVKRRSALYARITDILQRYKDTQADLAYSVNALMDVSTSSKELDEYIKEMKNVNQMFFLEKEIEHIGLPREEIYNYFVDLIYTKYKKGHHILWNIFPDQIFKAINVGKMAVPIKDEEGEYFYFGESYSFKIMDINLEEIV